MADEKGPQPDVSWSSEEERFVFSDEHPIFVDRVSQRPFANPSSSVWGVEDPEAG